MGTLLTGPFELRIALARRITDEALRDAAQLADPIGAGRSRAEFTGGNEQLTGSSTST